MSSDRVKSCEDLGVGVNPNGGRGAPAKGGKMGGEGQADLPEALYTLKQRRLNTEVMRDLLATSKQQLWRVNKST